MTGLGFKPAQAEGIVLPSSGAIKTLPQQSMLKGLRVDPTNAFALDFYVDPNGSASELSVKRGVYEDLVKYFLAALTVAEKDQWVNLSPYEKDRIIAPNFSQTQMGQDLLKQDHVLKQISSSILNPQTELGSKFWEKIYAQAPDHIKNSSLSIQMFHKIWIVPHEAVVYQKDNCAFIVKSSLKVMLEEDYLARVKQPGAWAGPAAGSQILSTKQHPSPRGETNEKLMAPAASDKISDPASPATNASSVFRDIILPAIEREVNEGERFAPLRQIYAAMILATWYKKEVKEGLLSGGFVNASKTDYLLNGENSQEQTQATYDAYLKALKKGSFNTVREEYDPKRKQMIARKYATGGFSRLQNTKDGVMMVSVTNTISPRDQAALSDLEEVHVNLHPTPQIDQSMFSVQTVAFMSFKMMMVGAVLASLYHSDAIFDFIDQYQMKTVIKNINNSQSDQEIIDIVEQWKENFWKRAKLIKSKDDETKLLKDLLLLNRYLNGFGFYLKFDSGEFTLFRREPQAPPKSYNVRVLPSDQGKNIDASMLGVDKVGGVDMDAEHLDLSLIKQKSSNSAANDLGQQNIDFEKIRGLQPWIVHISQKHKQIPVLNK